MASTSTCNDSSPYWRNEIVSMHQVKSSDKLLEINHACIDCPLDPQRLARLNGTTDDCAGGFGYLDIGNTHSARAARMVESDHEVVMRSLRAAGHSCAALQLAP